MKVENNNTNALENLKAKLIREEREKIIPEEREKIKTIEDVCYNSGDLVILDMFRKAEKLIEEKDKDKLQYFHNELIETAKQFKNEEYHYEAEIVSDIAHALLL